MQDHRTESERRGRSGWLVDVTTNGRIGSRGRLVRRVPADEAWARKSVRHCLQHRAIAPGGSVSPTGSPS